MNWLYVHRYRSLSLWFQEEVDWDCGHILISEWNRHVIPSNYLILLVRCPYHLIWFYVFSLFVYLVFYSDWIRTFISHHSDFFSLHSYSHFIQSEEIGSLWYSGDNREDHSVLHQSHSFLYSIINGSRIEQVSITAFQWSDDISSMRRWMYQFDRYSREKSYDSSW